MDDRAGLSIDQEIMRRCFDLAIGSARNGGYPYAAIVTRRGRTLGESTNRVAHDGDVTRHAEVVALSGAQKTLRCTSLDDCTLYANIEPCALCCYAIREARIAKVVFGLSSPVMGGLSRWNILGDERLSATMPDVFAPPPRIVPNFLSAEADATLRRAAPIVWAVTRSRGLFRREPLHERPEALPECPRCRTATQRTEKAMRLLRLRVFDRFGRRGSR
jgi:tRNA(adenine34) deaminase